jgi:succinate dehydrogenase / fumarate reductase, cytochrome b subunit
MDIETTAPATKAHRPRPLSPNIQIYRPQLTSVLSIANRIAGVVLSIGAVGLVIWLSAAAAGPEPYAAVQQVIGSWVGLVILFGFTFASSCICAAASATSSGIPFTGSNCDRSIFPAGP